jgi:hypothetical protein
MMSEREKAPSIGLRKTLGIFYNGINSVKWPIAPRPEGSVLEPSGNGGLRTRVNSFTMSVPSGNFPVFL